MATFSIPLTDIEVDAWFPPEQPIEEELIQGGTGTYTVSTFGTTIGYYLTVDGGKHVNPLRLGQPVTARGKDHEGKWVITSKLETIKTGDQAQFKGGTSLGT